METSLYDHIEWENTLAKQYLLKRGGSKAGSYHFLHDTQPKLRKYLPKADYLAPDEDSESLLNEIDFSTPKIVRGCHELDVKGMVDLLDTWQEPRQSRFGYGRNLDSAERKNAVRQAIENIRNDARHEVIREFVEYESGQPFDGNIGVLIQDYCDLTQGSIIEHPHKKGLYRIAYASGAVFEDMYDSNGCKDHFGDKDVDPEASRIITLYQQIRESGLMPGNYSWQMEFGSSANDLQFYQARLFRPYEKPAEFDLRDVIFSDVRARGTDRYDVYGITPPEGLDMYRVPLYSESHDEKNLVEQYKDHPRVAYAYSAVNRLSTSLLSRPRNMYAFLPYQPYSLEHGYYRWAQKAPVTLIGMGSWNKNGGHVDHDSFFPQNSADETRVKIFSNGIKGAIQFLK